VEGVSNGYEKSFLNGELKEEVYGENPPSYEAHR